MTASYDRAGFLKAFLSGLRQDRAKLDLRQVAQVSAQFVEGPEAQPPAVMQPIAAAPVPTVQDKEFEAVRGLALAAIKATARAQRNEADAVAAILAAGPTTTSAKPSNPHSTPDDIAVAAILAAGPSLS